MTEQPPDVRDGQAPSEVTSPDSRRGRAAGLAVVITALFGSDRFSERAFRLLRRLADRPEPTKRDRG
ncbi:hypothetical protein [Microbispora amethystogenes]|uniref:hypothetical protein n=1 Tax=Microbispora amethystogenes TaxID=1427754 RepID=UPI001954DCB5|nr:hypothetical protein [Microbispora amethystogenes]